MSEKTVIDFDIDKYLRNSKRLDLSGIDWEDIPNHPLTDGDVMCMHYMMDIETHTVIYLRDVLATRAANDPHVTAFLSCWVYEELCHGEAFSDFLRAYGLEVPAEPKLPDGSTPKPTRPTRVAKLREQLGVGHKLSLLPTMLGSMATRDFVAMKMQEEVDALALYLFGDAPEGRDAIREIDATISELPGFEGLTLLEDVLDEALQRAERQPGYAGVAPLSMPLRRPEPARIAS